MLTFLQSTAVIPPVPGNGSIEPYQNTLEGAEIFFGCNPWFVPAGRMRAVCRADGRWDPDPATLVCTCELIRKVPTVWLLITYAITFQ